MGHVSGIAGQLPFPPQLPWTPLMLHLYYSCSSFSYVFLSEASVVLAGNCFRDRLSGMIWEVYSDDHPRQTAWRTILYYGW